MVATNIGGGILGLPFAYYQIGLINSIILNLAMAVIGHLANMMYLMIKDLTPRRYESVYEISYLLMGRPSIFFMSLIFFMANFASMVMYYIIIGDTVSKLCAQAFVEGSVTMTVEERKDGLESESWLIQVLSHRTTTILFVGSISLLFIFKRKLEELKSVSYVFFCILFLFITLLGV